MPARAHDEDDVRFLNRHHIPVPERTSVSLAITRMAAFIRQGNSAGYNAPTPAKRARLLRDLKAQCEGAKVRTTLGLVRQGKVVLLFPRSAQDVATDRITRPGMLALSWAEKRVPAFQVVIEWSSGHLSKPLTLTESLEFVEGPIALLSA